MKIELKISATALSRIQDMATSYKKNRMTARPVACLLIRDNLPIIGFVPPPIDKGSEKIYHANDIFLFIEDTDSIREILKKNYVDFRNNNFIFIDIKDEGCELKFITIDFLL